MPAEIVYQLRRYAAEYGEDEYEVLEEAERQADLEEQCQYLLAGPDGPVVGSRYADYRIVCVVRTAEPDPAEVTRAADAARRLLFGG